MKYITNPQPVTINKEVGTVGEWSKADIKKLIPEGMVATDLVDTESASLEDTDKAADVDDE